MLSAVQSQVRWFPPRFLNEIDLSVFLIRFSIDQMGAVDATFDELSSIFDTGGSKGLTRDTVDQIPKIKITGRNNLDASGDEYSCSVCLQVHSLSAHYEKNPLTFRTHNKTIGFIKCLFCFFCVNFFAGFSAWWNGKKLAAMSSHVSLTLHRQLAPQTRILSYV